MEIIAFNKENDFADDNYNIYQEDLTQRYINILRKNLTESDIYTQLFNNFNFEKIMRLNLIEEEEEKKNQEKENKQNLSEIDNKEQIDEVKINMFMVIYNNCDYSKSNEYSSYIKDDYIQTRRLIIEDCEIGERNLKVKSKSYKFIPINTKDTIFPSDLGQITISKDEENKNEKKSIKLLIDGHKAMNEDTFKEKFKDQLSEELNYLKNLRSQASISSSSKSQNSIKLSKKTDNSDTEINGKRFYILKNNQIQRYIFSSYKKQIDGIYTEHKEIILNIKGKVSFDEDSFKNKSYKNYLENNYNINNDLKAHILFKNFDEESIPENEPIILEVKKSFKLYDLLNQIKQISKVAKNLVLQSNIPEFPKYIIGYICSYSEKEIEIENFTTLNGKYKNTNKTLLEHDLEVINENEIKVIICLIKDEQICGYDLCKEDYNSEESEKKKIKNRVELAYLCEKIIPEKSKEIDINKIINKYKEKYQSLTYEKNISLSEHYSKIEKIMEKNEKIMEEKEKINEKIMEENEKMKDEIERLKKEIERLKNLDKKETNQANNNNG